MSTTIKPLIKNKFGDYTDAGNYRAIALSNVETKILESLLLNKITTCDDYDRYQFGFKKGHSTGLCTSVVKTKIDYYVSRGSHVFVCFIDATKAFDRVNYWKQMRSQAISFNQLNEVEDEQNEQQRSQN